MAVSLANWGPHAISGFTSGRCPIHKIAPRPQKRRLVYIVVKIWTIPSVTPVRRVKVVVLTG
jgi:hypothetical protein